MGFWHKGSDFSRLFLYYCERSIEGHVSDDSGASLTDGISVMERQGVCVENIWPYDIAKFKEQPTHQCYLDATHHRITNATNISNNLIEV